MRGPSPVPENSQSILYTADLAKVIIRIVAVIALVASIIGIDDDALTDFKNGHFRPEFVDRTCEFVPKSQRSVLLAGKGSLNDGKRKRKIRALLARIIIRAKGASYVWR